MGNFFSPSLEELENRLMDQQFHTKLYRDGYRKTNPKLAKEFDDQLIQIESLLARIRLTESQDQLVEVERDVRSFMQNRLLIDDEFVNDDSLVTHETKLKREKIKQLTSFKEGMEQKETNETSLVPYQQLQHQHQQQHQLRLMEGVGGRQYQGLFTLPTKKMGGVGERRKS